MAPTSTSTWATLAKFHGTATSRAARWQCAALRTHLGKDARELHNQQEPGSLLDGARGVQTPTARRRSRQVWWTVRHSRGQTYPVQVARPDFPPCASCSLEDEKWELAGEGDFTGTFYLFQERSAISPVPLFAEAPRSI